MPATVKLVAVAIECGGVTKLADPKSCVDIGEACGPHLIINPCPVCGEPHEIDANQFRSYVG